MPLVELSSSLFDLRDVIPPSRNQDGVINQNRDSDLHIPMTFRHYKPYLVANLEGYYDLVRWQESDFPSKMWLLLAGEAPTVVMPWIMNGDNLADAITDMVIANALTQVRGEFGPNVSNLIVVSPFADFRQDKPSSKVISAKGDEESAEELAMVVAQSSWTQTLASLMKHTAGVNTYITVDSHSYEAQLQFENAGINMINVTTAKLMLEYLRHLGLLNDHLENMVVGVDLGNLPLAHKLHEEEGFAIGIINKHRYSQGRGEKSVTDHKWAYGDVRGKRVILMDDMIGSGGTILKTINLLLELGATEIIVCASHAVFAGREYYEQLQEVLKHEKVKIVLVTDTLPLRRPVRGGDKDLPYVDMKDRFGKVHRREVDMLGVDAFLAYIIGVALREQTADKIRKSLSKHVVEARDPYDLFYKITGKKLSKPKVVAKYLEGGEIVRSG